MPEYESELATSRPSAQCFNYSSPPNSRKRSGKKGDGYYFKGYEHRTQTTFERIEK